eukprot:2269692-Pyramimonas_sp.AAC.1
MDLEPSETLSASPGKAQTTSQKAQGLPNLLRRPAPSHCTPRLAAESRAGRNGGMAKGGFENQLT